MTSYLVLTLGLLAAQPGEDCGCGDQQVEKQEATNLLPVPESDLQDVLFQAPTYCYCPKFMYSYYPGYNYWVVARHGLKSDGSGQYYCPYGDEVLVYTSGLKVGACDGSCGGNCKEGLFGGFGQGEGKSPKKSRRKGKGKASVTEDQPADVSAEVNAEEDAEDDADDDESECPSLPSLRLANKKKANGKHFDFDYPEGSNGHVIGANRGTYVKVLKNDNSDFTWLKVFDVALNHVSSGPAHERRHRLGYEIEEPIRIPAHEEVKVDSLKGIKIMVSATKFCSVDGLYELTLPGGETYNVRMHSDVP
jgi:hypothetical protein